MTPELMDERLVLSRADMAVLLMLTVVGAVVALAMGYAMGAGIDSMVGDLLRWWHR